MDVCRTFAFPFGAIGLFFRGANCFVLGRVLAEFTQQISSAFHASSNVGSWDSGFPVQKFQVQSVQISNLLKSNWNNTKFVTAALIWWPGPHQTKNCGIFANVRNPRQMDPNWEFTYFFDYRWTRFTKKKTTASSKQTSEPIGSSRMAYA